MRESFYKCSCILCRGKKNMFLMLESFNNQQQEMESGVRADGECVSRAVPGAPGLIKVPVLIRSVNENANCPISARHCFP